MEPTQIESTNQPIQLPTRPQPTSGWKAKTLALSSNHFTMKIHNPKTLIKVYAVHTDPPIPEDWRYGMERIIKEATDHIREFLGADFCLAGKNIFSIGGKSDEQKAFVVKVRGKEFTLFIKKARETNLSYEAFKDNQTAQPTRQYLNILVKKSMKYDLKFMEWGRNSKYYDTDNVITIKQHNIDIYQGFKTSCEVYSNFTPKLLIDFSSKILRNDSALAFIKKLPSKEAIAEEMLGRSVVASYGNCRMYQVDDVDFSKNPLSTFIDAKGNTISYCEYYLRAYEIKIRDTKQPLFVCLLNRGKRTIYLVPELVQLTGLSDEMRRDFKVMQDVATYTRREPKDRMDSIMNLNAHIKKPLEKQGITLEQVSDIQGYRLEYPVITFGDDKPFIPDKGNFQLNCAVKKPGQFVNWAFVYHQDHYDLAGDILFNFKKVSTTLGIRVEEPVWVEVAGKQADSWEESLRSYLAKNKDTVQLAVVLIPKYLSNSLYKSVKKICSKEFGVLSQVVLDSSFRKNVYSVCSKVLQQMNVKIGNPLWWTSMPKSWGPRKAMVIGVDVFHSTKNGKKSVVGFCASLDKNLTKFFSKVKVQPGVGKEIIKTIDSLVQEALVEFNTLNKFLPEMVIIYRDGVGESQLPDVIREETNLIKEMFGRVKEGYKPQFTEIVVTKRINDRFFVRNDRKGFVNPPSGTVVARDVVSNNFDFFLVAQDVTMGTCTPTHYNVIYNDTNLPEEAFYELTYFQCFNYPNWSGPIRVPAALMYAHKIAFVTGQTYQSDHHARLNTKPFYL